jgi:hypothetical protein
MGRQSLDGRVADGKRRFGRDFCSARRILLISGRNLTAALRVVQLPGVINERIGAAV